MYRAINVVIAPYAVRLAYMVKFYLLKYPKLKSEVHVIAINPQKLMYIKCRVLLSLLRQIDETNHTSNIIGVPK